MIISSPSNSLYFDRYKVRPARASMIVVTPSGDRLSRHMSQTDGDGETPGSARENDVFIPSTGAAGGGGAAAAASDSINSEREDTMRLNGARRKISGVPDGVELGPDATIGMAGIRRATVSQAELNAMHREASLARTSSLSMARHNASQDLSQAVSVQSINDHSSTLRLPSIGQDSHVSRAEDVVLANEQVAGESSAAHEHRVAEGGNAVSVENKNVANRIDVTAIIQVMEEVHSADEDDIELEEKAITEKKMESLPISSSSSEATSPAVPESNQ